MRPIRILEIISADKRCSNHTLASFGICVNQPVMVVGALIKEMKKAFGRGVEEIQGSEGYMLKDWVPQFRQGHYIIYSRGHAMAVHNGALVDTAKRGIGQTKVIHAWRVMNFDRQLDIAFQDYERNHPDTIFRGAVQRKPKQRPFSLDMLMKSLKRSGYRNASPKDVANIATTNNWGRPESGFSALLVFTKGEAQKVMQAYIASQNSFQRVAMGRRRRR